MEKHCRNWYFTTCESKSKKIKDTKHCIATNIYEWFIISAAYFEKLFLGNEAFAKEYEEWRKCKKVTKDTSLFYNEIAKPFIDKLENEIHYTFSIKKYMLTLCC